MSTYPQDSPAPTRKIGAAAIAAVLAIIARIGGFDLGPDELNVIAVALAPIITGYLVRSGLDPNR